MKTFAAFVAGAAGFLLLSWFVYEMVTWREPVTTMRQTAAASSLPPAEAEESGERPAYDSIPGSSCLQKRNRSSFIGGFITTAAANARTGPGTQYEVEKRLPADYEVSGIQICEGWIQFAASGTGGVGLWVHADLVEDLSARKARETQELLERYGPRPKIVDGVPVAVVLYLKTYAHDPMSLQVEGCGDLYHWNGSGRKGWLVPCAYRGKNAFGARVLNENWFIIRDHVVIDVKEPDEVRIND
jgi:hypothetical protein